MILQRKLSKVKFSYKDGDYLILYCLFEVNEIIPKKIDEVLRKEGNESFFRVLSTQIVNVERGLFQNYMQDFGELIYTKNLQRNLVYLGVDALGGGVDSNNNYCIQDSFMLIRNNFDCKPATIGAYLIKGGRNQYRYYANAANVNKLQAVLDSSNISDFAICDSNAALAFLKGATDLPFEMQDKQPKQNKDGLFHVPVKISWKAIFDTDSVPCEITVTYRYSVPHSATRQTHVKIGWEIKVKPLGVTDFILID